jgi:hypothetical protein
MRAADYAEAAVTFAFRWIQSDPHRLMPLEPRGSGISKEFQS